MPPVVWETPITRGGAAFSPPQEACVNLRPATQPSLPLGLVRGQRGPRPSLHGPQSLTVVPTQAQTKLARRGDGSRCVSP